jgi:transposase-like protein
MLYFYPERSKEYIKLKKKQLEIIKGKVSFRKIEELTGINYQSVAKTVNKILEDLQSIGLNQL